jgi:hypothetical protein
MKTFNLEKLLKAAGQRMRLDLAEQLIPHSGELGASRETIIRGFLQNYLPKRFDVTTGFLFDCSGKVSDQLDVIIANTLASPRFETVGGKRFFPCEAVVAVGQVKSALTSRAEFAKAFRNLESAKSLDRSAGGTACDIRSGEILNPLENHKDQIFTFLLVTGRALGQRSAQEFILEHVLATAPHVWPNIVLALDRYLATFCCDSGVCPNPMDARGVAVQPDDGILLMRFYLLLGRAIEVTRVSGLPYWEYLQSATNWTPEIWHDTYEYPPRYLSSITSG